ncbi:MAG: ubiquinone/menaquinone biosynthesis protein [Bdellovibrionaceae bacterium]|nr:ubiquinone/menaquinone biosynthesis protein [Pseudobdellovibrionaceae bacterium]|tara:strand:+ start:80742 stop:81776 length:1035 start_codon:yes stop_codon:yes gene_type:complete
MISEAFDQIKYRTLAYARLALYSLESLPIQWSRRWIDQNSIPPSELPKSRHQDLLQSFESMVRKDIANIRQGLYTSDLVGPENPTQHLSRYLKIFTDSLFSSYRKSLGVNKHFSEEASVHLEDLPDYYKRNFHFQTDGYLSEQSAQFYGHQTEILFRGTLDLMRRSLLGGVLREIQESNGPLHLLELGCGAGELTRILAQSGEQVKIHAIDLSQPYLEMAQSRSYSNSNVTFQRADAETYSSSEKYDYIFSGYMFHELPDDVRRAIVENAFSLLKPGGKFVLLDSLQKDDDSRFNWALEQFPKQFHEPFYKNYIAKPLEPLMKKHFSDVTTEVAFLSKAITAKK